MPDPFNEAVGRRLRAIRRQKGWSLQEVEAVSSAEFKASVLGAYERGERSLSLPRLQRLAAFYAVPADQLLPPMGADDAASGITIDLARIEKAEASHVELLGRFLSAIQLMREDFNGRVLTIRRSDLRLLASILETTEAELTKLLSNQSSVVVA